MYMDILSKTNFIHRQNHWGEYYTVQGVEKVWELKGTVHQLFINFKKAHNLM
jgi:hypothetical protein